MKKRFSKGHKEIYILEGQEDRIKHLVYLIKVLRKNIHQHRLEVLGNQHVPCEFREKQSVQHKLRRCGVAEFYYLASIHS